jgi:hypothetical protein
MNWYMKKRSEWRDWTAGLLRKWRIGLCLAPELDHLSIWVSFGCFDIGYFYREYAR